ncbi:MAG: site-specific integrase [Bacteroidetes bacterium]|nr:site-specific integrase [Bacteroidota bacterium]
MEKISYKLVFNRKKQLRKDGTGAIQIECYQNGKRKYFDTKIHVEPIYWDDKNKRVKGGHRQHVEFNYSLKEQITDLERFEHGERVNGKSIDLLKLAEYQKGNIQKSFTQYFKNYIQTDLSIKEITKKRYRDTLGKLERFRADILFDQLNYTLITEFDQYLRGLKLAVNTVHGHHKNIKKVIHLAINNDILIKNPYSKFKVTKERTNKTALTESELKLIENYTIAQDDKLMRIKDMFLLSCYTGLRYSDISILSSENIYKNKLGYILKIESYKTGKPLELSLYLLFQNANGMSKPELIIQKYIEILEHKPFKIENQYYNRCLKELAQSVGIKKILTSHVARHTFGTIMASKKIPISILKELMQHSDFATTNIYVHMSNDMLNDGLKDVTW